MATAVGTAFLEFREHIRTLEVPAATVERRRELVRASLSKRVALTAPGLFLAGSQPRGTEVAPGAAIDLFATLDYGRHRPLYQPDRPDLVLDFVADALAEYLPEGDVSRRADGQAVHICFDDVDFDLTPAFPKHGGAYMIPNAEVGHWTAVDTRRYEAIMTRANAHLAGMLKPVVRMLKIWNRGHGELFKGYHLEVMALNALHTYYPDCNYAGAIRQAFSLLAFVMQYPTRDPVGVGEAVDAYLDVRARRRQAMALCENAYQQAREAEAAGRRTLGQGHAIGLWRDLFGTEFPAYTG
ncbi:MAG: hypothetical protein IT340_03060 [Chloroflexi bacterium]|nr:hypothetical protein [Chloroflexota bacterium]